MKKTQNHPENIKEDKRSNEKGQPIMNIGLVGHVDHGKTTLTERLSGKWTDVHSEELKRGITIRLGYANFSIFKCEKCGLYTTKSICPKCGAKTNFLRKYSIVDAPGHESLMATMLSGANIMDAALLLVSADEKCPQPQTREHLIALEISDINQVLVVQNKIDLVSKERAIENFREIKAFLENTRFKDAPIIPISALMRVNIDILLKYIYEYFKPPKRDENADLLMFVTRSFDVNLPGTDPLQLVGGVLGGAIKQGKISVGDDIEIVPGREITKHNKKEFVSIKTKVTKIMSGDIEIKSAVPGGSIAISTTLDPCITKSDSLSGQIVVHPGKAPPVWHELKIKPHLLDYVIGLKKEVKVEPIKQGELLMLNAYSTVTVGIVSEISKDYIKCKLKLPIAAYPNTKVTISRNIENRFRLIGYGVVL